MTDVKIKKVYKKVEDFLRDDEFIKTVLSSSSLSVPYLEKLRKENSGCSSLINIAISILKSEVLEVSALTDGECILLKERIFRSLGFN